MTKSILILVALIVTVAFLFGGILYEGYAALRDRRKK